MAAASRALFGGRERTDRSDGSGPDQNGRANEPDAIGITTICRTSRQEIEDAERHLSRVLQDLGAAPRAQKTTISGVVQTAFDRLRAARESLDQVEKLIKSDPGG